MLGYLKNKIDINLFFIAFAIICAPQIFAQTKQSTKSIIKNGDTIVMQAIPLTSITKNIELAIIEINSIKEHSKPDEKIISADSIYHLATKTLNTENISISDINSISDRALDDALKQWGNYKLKLNNWHIYISARSLLLTNLSTQTGNMITVWELTLKDAKNQNAPQRTLLNIRDIINRLKELENNLKAQILDILSLQSKLTELALFIDDTVKKINEQKQNLRNAYLKQDSPPIWNAYDSSFHIAISKEVFISATDESLKALNIFYIANKGNFKIHILVFILIILLLHFLFKYSLKSEETDTMVIRAKEVLNNYLLAALILGLLCTYIIYPTRQLVIDDIVQLLLLILISIFLPKVTNKKISIILYYAIGLHFINQLQLLLPPDTLSVRLILFLEVGVTFIVFRNLLDKDGFLYNLVNKTKWDIVLKLIKLSYSALIISLLANIFGFVNLSIFTNNLTTNALLNAIIIYAGLFIFNNTIILILKSDYILLFHSIRNHRQKILTALIKYSSILAIFTWVISVLKLFGIYEGFLKSLSNLFSVKWEFGNISIELGSVLSFLMVITITFFIAKAIKIILEEEVFTRIKLPRGIPGAISMVIRYFIVGWGIVLSLKTLHINLSDFGLMAGALGVGIGFGLQNIVFNFIAGLVLAFERPIQVGDTIEAGTVEGTVKSIGVRSSTVLTFDGSEVIVPNGSLISNNVINWTLSDRRKRRDIFVGVEYGSDPHLVMEILRKAAADNINVLQNPDPWILFEGFGDSSLDFRLRIWTLMDVGMTTKSQVTIAIYDGLNEAGISIPYPQQDLHLKSIEPEVEQIILKNNKKTRSKQTIIKKD